MLGYSAESRLQPASEEARLTKVCQEIMSMSILKKDMAALCKAAPDSDLIVCPGRLSSSACDSFAFLHGMSLLEWRVSIFLGEAREVSEFGGPAFVAAC